MVDVLRTGSRIDVLSWPGCPRERRFATVGSCRGEAWRPAKRHSTKSGGRDRPCGPLTRGSQGPAPYFEEGAGRESNLRNHVLRSGSRVFVCSRRRVCQRFVFRHGTQVPVGLEPTRRLRGNRMTCRVCHVLQQAVGIFSKGRRSCESETYGVLPIELRRDSGFELRRWDSNPHPPGYEPCTPTRQSTYVFIGDEGCGQRLPHGNRTRRPTLFTSEPDSLDGPDVLQPAVAVFVF